MSFRLSHLSMVALALAVAFIAVACARPPATPDVSANPIAALHLPEQNSTWFSLTNGLEVVVVERHEVPLVTILAAVKNGAMAESPEYDGLSHLYEHMFFKGNAVLPDQQAYMARTRELGMSFNGFTSTEAVQYFFTLPSHNLAPGLAFMRDALVSPLFSEEELKTEINTVLAEYDRNESSPYFFLDQAVTEALFPAFTSRKNVLGLRGPISNATREKMLTIQRRYYVPNNTLLVVAGDVDPEEVRALVEREYLAWPRAEDPYIENPVPTHPALTEDKTIVVEKPYSGILVTYAWQGPSVDIDRGSTYAADVFSFILGQRSSRFQRELVDSGLLQYAGFSYYTQRHVGPITFTGMLQPAQAKEAVDAMQAQLDAFLSDDYYSDEELDAAKLNLAVDSIYEWQRNDKIAQTLGFWWCVADMGYRTSYIDNIRAVTRADIRRFLETYVAGRPHVKAVLVSPQNKDALPDSLKTGLTQAQTTDESTDVATEGQGGVQ